MEIKYNLTDQPKSGDKLSYNIFKKRKKIYSDIVKFTSLKYQNTGVFAENILRMVFDAINLNHFQKNHPYVDIAIVNPIEGLTKKSEIISVKSSINYSRTSTLLTSSKAIKIESLFSYVLFAHFGYDLDFTENYYTPKKLLNKAINLVKDGIEDVQNGENIIPNNYDYEQIVNVVIYYLMFKNNKESEEFFDDDIIRVMLDDDTNLKYGTYEQYFDQVMERLNRLQTPISLGVSYMLNKDSLGKDDENLICVIEKTNTISLKDFWQRLLSVWCNNEYFGTGVTKYLNFKDISKVYDIKDGKFPIKIEIETNGYGLEDIKSHSNKTKEEKEILRRKKTARKTQKLYMATKFKDADFGDDEKAIVNTFGKIIDVLEDNPKLYTKFQNFVTDLKK